MAGFKDIINRFNPFTEKVVKLESPRTHSVPMADFTGYTGGNYRPLYAYSFNGEKNLGEIGPIKNYIMDYEALRLRSWQSYTESEITRTVINKIIKWSIGKGLKLQAQPNIKVLAQEGITIDQRIFSDQVESRFEVYASSNRSDYNQMRNLNHIETQVMLNSKLGGDVLIILRYQNDTVNVQLVDGSHVISPRYGNEWYPLYLKNGNRIMNGVEVNPDTNEHIAYHIRKPGLVFETERIEAKNGAGLVQAFLVYGTTHRIDNMRGVPLIGTVLETLKKLERYKEATIGSAEERQKIVYQIEHQIFSTGESPLEKTLSKAHDYDAIINDALPADEEGKQLANTVSATTNKQTFNMPLGAKMSAVDSKNELYFKEFYDTNFEVVCACLDVPPEVARAMYNSNYSASRAALKEWEYSLQIHRSDTGNQFLKHVYAFWLHIEILKNKISAPGYIQAFQNNNWMALESFYATRWVGATVPHIDPLKEVQAERMKLGDTSGSIPLTTVEMATEALNGGDSESNMTQYAEEFKKSTSLGIVPPEPPMTPKPKTE